MHDFSKTLSKLLLFAFLCTATGAIQAQEDTPITTAPAEDAPPAPKQYYLFSPRVSVTVPHPMSNSAFKKSFVGIYEASGGLNIYPYKGIFLGVTYKNGLLKITENKIADYNASMYINNAGAKLGTDIFVTENHKVIFSASVGAGQNWTRYSGLVSKDSLKIIPTTYSCVYVEPEINLFFLIESNFGIGATLSYSIFNKNFDPYELALTDWTNYNAVNNGSTQYFSFGFGFYYSFLRKEKKKSGY